MLYIPRNECCARLHIWFIDWRAFRDLILGLEALIWSSQLRPQIHMNRLALGIRIQGILSKFSPNAR